MDQQQATTILTKKEARKKVEENLALLKELESVLGKKKFRRRIDKAGKLLSNGLPKAKKVKVKKAKAGKVKTEIAA